MIDRSFTIRNMTNNCRRTMCSINAPTIRRFHGTRIPGAMEMAARKDVSGISIAQGAICTHLMVYEIV